MPKDSVAELTRPHRTTVQGLIEVWNKVREITEDRLEFITRNGLSSTLDESIFSRTEEDEIVLCLNYDGIYGINNINKLLDLGYKNKDILNKISFKFNTNVQIKSTELSIKSVRKENSYE